MSLLELAPYRLGEPVFEVKASQNYVDAEEILPDTVYHRFYPVKGFDFVSSLPVSQSANATDALAIALKHSTNGYGFYYSLIKNGIIVSMQYVNHADQVRMVED